MVCLCVDYNLLVKLTSLMQLITDASLHWTLFYWIIILENKLKLKNWFFWIQLNGYCTGIRKSKVFQLFSICYHLVRQTFIDCARTEHHTNYIFTRSMYQSYAHQCILFSFPISLRFTLFIHSHPFISQTVVWRLPSSLPSSFHFNRHVEHYHRVFDEEQ